MPYGISWKNFARDLFRSADEDVLVDQAATLAYYLMLAIFPAMISLLSLLPFLQIPQLESSILDLLRQALPGDAAKMFTETIRGVVSEKSGSLLSFGLVLALWSASSGTYAIMEQINLSYRTKDARPFWKRRGLAVLLALFFGVLIIAAFVLIVLGGVAQEYMRDSLQLGGYIITLFAIVRWFVIVFALLLSIATLYYVARNVREPFRLITPGSLLAVGLLIAASLGFKAYVENFANYNATYGSIGAVIVLMLWLYILGLVILLGSEVNALIARYAADQPATSPPANPDTGH